MAGNVRWSSSTSQIIILLVSTASYIACLLLLKFYFIAMLHNAFPCSSLPSALQSSTRTSELSLSSPVLQYLGCTELCQWGTRCAAVGQNFGFWHLAEQCSWIVLCGLSLWAREQWLKGCASVTVLLSFHFMMHVLLFFFSFVRITTYSFLMLLKIPCEFMGMLWWLPCASEVCLFSGQDGCPDSTIYRAFTCVLAKKYSVEGIFTDKSFLFVLVQLHKNSTFMMMKKE